MKEGDIMMIQVHFENPNVEEDNEQMVQELLVMLALKRMVNVPV